MTRACVRARVMYARVRVRLWRAMTGTCCECTRAVGGGASVVHFVRAALSLLVLVRPSGRSSDGSVLDVSNLTHSKSVLEKMEVDNLHYKGAIRNRMGFEVLKASRRIQADGMIDAIECVRPRFDVRARLRGGCRTRPPAQHTLSLPPASSCSVRRVRTYR